MTLPECKAREQKPAEQARQRYQHVWERLTELRPQFPHISWSSWQGYAIWRLINEVNFLAGKLGKPRWPDGE